MRAERIGILTGGGDVPGLNSCIKVVVYQAADNGWEVVGIRRGWEGLLNYDKNDPASRRRNVKTLTRQGVRTIDRYGGTHLHASRTNPQNVKPEDVPDFIADKYTLQPGQKRVDCTGQVLDALGHLGISRLITIGGDDTLSFSARLDREGFPVVGIPKTMDNDVNGTDYCIGFSTALTRSVDAINKLRTPTGSHERIAVVELFGRNSGETALWSGYLADADRTLISEVPFDVQELARLVMKDRRRNPSNYAMVVISEGARMIDGRVVEGGTADNYGHLKLGGIGQITGQALKELTGVDIANQQLAYLMRAGEPDSLDRMVGKTFGQMAIKQIESRRTGVMVAIADGNYVTVPVSMPIEGEKRVDVAAYYDTKEYKARNFNPFGKPMFFT